MVASHKRSNRIGESIAHELANLLQREVKDPRLVSITILGVRITDDLKIAKVYFSLRDVNLEPAERARGIKKDLNGLSRASGFLRNTISERLGLRYTPELHFYHDDTLEQGMRVESLLRRISEEGKAQ